jgi:predicted nucleic acid-binding protein
VTTFTAIYDACVLYPAPLRDLLMQIALTDVVRARWTDRIHDEWMRSVLKDNPHLTRTQLERTRDLMNANVRDALVTQFEPLIDGPDLPDLDDRHVLAAAIKCQAGVIVTLNLKDFPSACLMPYGLEAKHPDVFLADLFDLSPAIAGSAVKVFGRGCADQPPTRKSI